MGQKIEKKEKAKKQKTPLRVILTRAMAIFLAVLMLLSVLTILIPFLGLESYANGFDTAYQYDAPYQGDTLVRVGLMYGTGVTVGFETRAEYGFNVGYVDESNKFSALYYISEPCISVTCDSNLSKKGMTYLITNTQSPNVGGFHIQIPVSGEDIGQKLNELAYAAEQFGYDIFPAYINKSFCIRIGQFGSEAEANGAVPALGIAGAAVAQPSYTGVSVIDPNTDRILFEFDDGLETALGLSAALSDSGGTAYLVTPAKNTYSGVFEYERYRSGNTDGVALTNVLTLDEYVMGVMPSEISNQWPLQVQKAFAVTVRTFTVSMMNRHSAYGFDLCNSTHCQAYMGNKRTNGIVRQAVSETTNMILTYNGEPARTYYSAVAGGTTVSAEEAWGGAGSYPYLTAVVTPWEDYKGHKYGDWRVEISPKQLLNTLVKKGYTSLSGSIADVRIDSFAKNSTYVYSITFTDTNGKKLTIKTSDKIRIALSEYVNSANFVVARAGESVQRTVYTLNTAGQITAPAHEPQIEANIGTSVPAEGGHGVSSRINVASGDGIILIEARESASVISEYGQENIVSISDLEVITANGSRSYDMTSDIVDYGMAAYDANADYSVGADELVKLDDIKSIPTGTETETLTAEGTSGNFVFIGKGWGHGVGMSQYGALNMAELGYDYETILRTYFPGTEIGRYAY